MITLSEVLPHFNGSKAELARALGITRQAVTPWPLDAPIPELHELRLRYEILPGVFTPKAEQQPDEAA